MKWEKLYKAENASLIYSLIANFVRASAWNSVVLDSNPAQVNLL